MADMVYDTKLKEEKQKTAVSSGIRFCQGTLIGLGAVLPGISGGVFVCSLRCLPDYYGDSLSSSAINQKTLPHTSSADFGRRLRFCHSSEIVGISVG